MEQPGDGAAKKQGKHCSWQQWYQECINQTLGAQKIWERHPSERFSLSSATPFPLVGPADPHTKLSIGCSEPHPKRAANLSTPLRAVSSSNWPFRGSRGGCSTPRGAIFHVGAVSLQWPGFKLLSSFFLEGVVHYGGWIKRRKGELYHKSQSAAKAGEKNDAAKCLCSCLVMC